jgi:hypothetical protein
MITITREIQFAPYNVKINDPLRVRNRVGPADAGHDFQLLADAGTARIAPRCDLWSRRSALTFFIITEGVMPGQLTTGSRTELSSNVPLIPALGASTEMIY